MVGIVGGFEKCKYMKEEFGFDGVIDYKLENMYEVIVRECFEGIDVFFDNVGGEILDVVLVFIC